MPRCPSLKCSATPPRSAHCRRAVLPIRWSRSASSRCRTASWPPFWTLQKASQPPARNYRAVTAAKLWSAGAKRSDDLNIIHILSPATQIAESQRVWFSKPNPKGIPHQSPEVLCADKCFFIKVIHLGFRGFHGHNPGSMFELVCHMEVGAVAGFCLPHFPKDLQPPLPQTPQGTGMTFSFIT